MQTEPRPSLAGLRVLVVEDALLVADEIAAELRGFGCTVVGPAGRLENALTLARDEALDGAILDVNLAGQLCFPIADALAARRIPFFFLTGYTNPDLFPPEHREVPRISKPYDADELGDLAEAAFRRH